MFRTAHGARSLQPSPEHKDGRTWQGLGSPGSNSSCAVYSITAGRQTSTDPRLPPRAFTHMTHNTYNHPTGVAVTPISQMRA